MLPVQWSSGARKDLAAILHYIAERNPGAALSLKSRIDHVVTQLPSTPYIYRHGRAPGTREIVVHRNYVLTYRIRPTLIRIVAVTHTRRRIPLQS